MPDDIKVEKTSRSVIERKLLDTLNEREDCVAVLLNEKDLIDIIYAIEITKLKIKEFTPNETLLAGLEKLLNEAF